MPKKHNNPSTNTAATGTNVSETVVLAEIIGAHGVRGLVKIYCYGDNPKLIEQSPDFQITLKNKHKPNIWLAMIDGVHDKDTADALKGQTISLPAQALPPLNAADEGYYYHDLIGCRALTTEGDEIGQVIAVENFGAGDLLEIKPENAESFYLLFNDETVPDVDISAQTLSVIIPEQV